MKVSSDLSISLLIFVRQVTCEPVQCMTALSDEQSSVMLLTSCVTCCVEAGSATKLIDKHSCTYYTANQQSGAALLQMLFQYVLHVGSSHEYAPCQL